MCLWFKVDNFACCAILGYKFFRLCKIVLVLGEVQNVSQTLLVFPDGLCTSRR